MKTTSTCALVAGLLTGVVAQSEPVLLGPLGGSGLRGEYARFTDSPFRELPFKYFHFEDFEDGVLNAPGVSAFGDELRINPGDDSVDSDDGQIDGSGTAGVDVWAVGSPGITLSFDENLLLELPTHVGVVWTDGFNPITFEAYDAAGSLLGRIVGHHADPVNGGETADDRFYGVIHEGGIAKIVIFNPGGGIEIDHVQYGAASLNPSALAIVAQPQDQRALSGGTIDFRVSAVGGAPFSYQWRRNGVELRDDDRISGSDTALLEIRGVLPDDAGAYSVVVTNPHGSLTSASALLSVILEPPDITSDPEDQSVFSGSQAGFSVTATGSLPMVYQWYRDGVQLTEGAGILGIGTPTLTIADAQAADVGLYWVEIRNSYGATTSLPARLSVVLAPPQILAEPQASRVALGSTVTLHVQATGSLPLSYQWERDDMTVMDGAHTSGASTSTLTLSDLGLTELGAYRVVVQNPLGRVQSTAVSVTTFSVFLQIRRQDNGVVVWWNEAAQGATLLKTDSLTSPNWQEIAGSDAATSVTLPLEDERAFFRLAGKAHEILLDSEDLPRFTQLNDQYRARGIIFSADGDAGRILNHTAGDANTADFGSSGDQSYNCGASGLTTITLVQPAFRVSFRVGDGDAPPESFVIRFYTAAGVLLATETHTTYEGALQGGVDVAYEDPRGIGRVDLRGSPGTPSGFQLDDLRFLLSP